MLGIIGKKLGMTTLYDEAGRSVPCTIITGGPCVVTQIKNVDKDGYSAIQLGYDDKKRKKYQQATYGPFSEGSNYT